ncbi:putative MFS transporter [Rhodoblastus acidophilus]|uniref:MFS transporter n=1 Tax=Rhodoblastus acidophilus TaxID=1074 RepID=UPI0022256C5F|nr:MFS transporter [Rhodoblastus acidophilus]MCW2286450.1 putative MFS transporter [Rhodoblastus acidophilus]MCW2335299.1 putative MFS transporter [Rhodoblastus acidophilus]
MLIARLERLPITRPVFWARGVVGMATFFDGYTTLAIAYAMPVLAKTWGLTPTSTAAIISAGYVGQLFGAVFFGWLAERIGRLPVLIATIAIFAAMSCACIFAWDAQSLIIFRFLQGIGTGGEVPVASAYVSELSGAKKRGRFFLLYELLFLVGLVFAGMIGYALVPTVGWKAMFVVGVVPVALIAPLTFFLFESPRWLIGRGRLAAADKVISRFENSARRAGASLEEPRPAEITVKVDAPAGAWREIFGSFYGPRTYLLWVLWFGAYLVNNGLVTWLPTLYRTKFDMPVDQEIAYGFIMTGCAAVASLVCALTIDRVGRKRWYAAALLVAAIPLAALAVLGATSAKMVFVLATLSYSAIQTVTFSLYLYSGELYPTRLRSVGAGLGSAWLRLGSFAGPWVIGFAVASGGIAPVFAVFSGIAVATGLVCVRWAPETTGRVLEELSP